MENEKAVVITLSIIVIIACIILAGYELIPFIRDIVIDKVLTTEQPVTVPYDTIVKCYYDCQDKKWDYYKVLEINYKYNCYCSNENETMGNPIKKRW